MAQKPTAVTTLYNSGMQTSGDGDFRIQTQLLPAGNSFIVRLVVASNYATTLTASLQLYEGATLRETIPVNQDGNTGDINTYLTYDFNFTSSILGYATTYVNALNVKLDGGGGFQYTVTNTSQTFNVKNITSVTGSLLKVTTATNDTLLYLPSSFTNTLTHFKFMGAASKNYYLLTPTFDDTTSVYQVPTGSGLSVFSVSGGAKYIASYFGGTVTTGNSTGGTTATSPIVLVNITSGNKLVGLPNPATFASSYLCICAYTTGTSTTNSLVIITNAYAAETSSLSYSWTTAAGPSIGLFLVSDGTKWNIVGIYRGTNTTFDTTSIGYTAMTTPIALSSTNTTDSATPGITPASDSGSFHIWKTKAITYANGAVIGNAGNNSVNSSYRRFYRNDNVDYSGYIVLNTKVGAGTVTAFPLAQYPSDN